MSTENVQDIFTSDRSELSKVRRYMNSMMRYHFHTIRRELCLIEENAQWNDEVLGQLRLYEMELRIHERFSQWVAECRSFTDFHSSAVKKFIQIWSQQREGLSQRIGGSVTNWDSFACDLDINLEDSKLVIEECCKGLLSSSDDMLLPSNKRVAQFDEGLIFSLDAVISNLKDLLSYKASEAIPPNDQIDTLEIKLVFLRNYLKVTKMCIYNEDFQKLKHCIYLFANNAICQTFIYWVKKAASEYNANEMDLMLSDILLRVKPCRLDVLASDFPVLRYKGSVKDDAERYLDAIVNNLNDLIRLKAGKIVPLMKQIEILKHKLMFLQEFIILAAHCVNSRDFQKLMNYVHDFSKNAVQLTFLYWLKAGDEHTISEMICKICDTIQKIEPCTREVTNVYFGILKSMMLRRSDNVYLVQVVVSFVDLLLQKLLTVEGFHILRDGLIFVLSFIANPPIENANDDELSLVLQEIDVLLLERWHLIWSVDMKDFIEKEVHNFQQEIEIVNSRIRQRYCKYQYSSIHDFPRIIGRGFLDLLIRNLRNMKEELSSDTNLLSFVKYSIWKIEEQLVLIRPFINDTLELQNDNTSRLQLIDLAYLTERVVCLCFVFDYPIWYRLGCLHDLLNKIKVVKTKTEQIKGFKVYNVGVLPFSGTSTGINSKQTWTSDINQVVVGFEEDTNTIIDELIYGNKSLDIVSIVGMAGLGKTTLARKVYVAPSVKSHFHIFAFCSVSRYYDAKRLLLDILGNIIVIDDVSTKKDDLPLQLWKCLKGRRYLIVMDDIWEVRVWNDIKSSFPDDQNGSRVMFTTRFHNVARDAQIKFSPYHLAFLSEEKSWELLQKKAFSNGSCPPDLYDIGKLIAKNCKGLPLAVVLISGILSRTECSLSWWNEIAERVVSYISEEGCIKMLEFTYKYLPEYLKPLLLYFGTFPEDMSISVKNLIYLWIDEGFVR